MAWSIANKQPCCNIANQIAVLLRTAQSAACKQRERLRFAARVRAGAGHLAGNKQKSCQTLTISEQGVFRGPASLLRLARHG
jgi:hypothetical protein